jgi:TrpR-related protein YerC/YecD
MPRRRKAYEKVKTTPEEKNYPTEKQLALFRAILNLKNVEEAVRFFRDLLTLGEIEEFANRWQMAKLLYQGHSYIEVAEETEASTTTVARVAKWLFEGKDGYIAILRRLEK